MHWNWQLNVCSVSLHAHMRVDNQATQAQINKMGGPHSNNLLKITSDLATIFEHNIYCRLSSRSKEHRGILPVQSLHGQQQLAAETSDIA